MHRTMIDAELDEDDEMVRGLLRRVLRIWAAVATGGVEEGNEQCRDREPSERAGRRAGPFARCDRAGSMMSR